jgi:hypothetical protein
MRRWIDVLLVGAGGFCAFNGWPAPAVALVGLGAVMPALHWRAARREGDALDRLVTPDVVAAHRDVLAAAALPGVPDAGDALDLADEALLEVAALLAGRPPRGGAQRRFVAARVDAMASAAAALRDRHHAWTAARAEVDAIAPSALDESRTDGAPVQSEASGPLVGLLVVVLLPAFVLWDAVCGSGRALVALVDGFALRLRTAGALALRLVAGAGSLVVRGYHAWHDIRVHVMAAAKEARHHVVAARLRLRLQLRRARRRTRTVV